MTWILLNQFLLWGTSFMTPEEGITQSRYKGWINQIPDTFNWYCTWFLQVCLQYSMKISDTQLLQTEVQIMG